MDFRIQKLDSYNWIDQDGRFKLNKNPKTNKLSIIPLEDDYILSLSELYRIDAYFNLNTVSPGTGSTGGTGNTGGSGSTGGTGGNEFSNIGSYNDFEIPFASILGQTPQLDPNSTPANNSNFGTYQDFLGTFENGLL